MVKIMSNEVENELNELKKYLINEYRANGGTKDVTKYSAAMLTSEIESLKKIKALKDEISALKANVNPGAPAKVGAVDQSRENQSLAKRAAGVIGAYMDYVDAPWDPRSIDDERYLRDNQLVKDGVPNEDPSVVILRDAEGRLA